MPSAHSPRILLTNDDGINAPGLKILEKIARQLSDDIWIVAPEVEQSGAAHSLTLHHPVRVRKISARRYAVSGTPTDCVLLALKEIIPARRKQAATVLNAPHGARSRRAPEANKKVDLILSGVNRGSNVGDDISYSGTVAAAMEATLLNVPAVALSQLFYDGKTIHWDCAATHAPPILRKLLKAGWPEGSFINLNFPACAAKQARGVAVCPQGRRIVGINLHLRSDPRGRPYYWLGGDRDNTANGEQVDVAKLEAGSITVTPVQMDMTDYKALAKLEAVF